MSEIEMLLNSYPALFRQDLFGVGATLEKRWRYIVFSKFSDMKLWTRGNLEQLNTRHQRTWLAFSPCYDSKESLQTQNYEVEICNLCTVHLIRFDLLHLTDKNADN